MKRLFFLLLLTVSFSFSSRSQYVTIPDPVFKNKLMLLYPACFNASGLMDTTCNAIVNETTLNLTAAYSYNLDGLQYFKNLLDLTVSGADTYLPALPSTLLKFSLINNTSFVTPPPLPPGLTQLNFSGCSNLTTISGLPAGLISLEVWDINLLSSIPSLPATLVTLDINRGSLASLPSLPATLQTFICNHNAPLTSLPTFPAGLRILNCGYNGNITSIGTALPPSLTQLDFSVNKVSVLPVLPPTLSVLRAAGNLLTSLPAFSSALTDVDVRSNFLTTLPTFPPGVQHLQVDNNQLSSLPALPNTVKWFGCANNQITNLPALPASLENLVCSNNFLTSLPVLPTNFLNTIYCDHNQLTTLPALPGALTNLYCMANQITSLPAFPSTLTYFWCDSNSIDYLPTLPGSLTHLSIVGTGITCLPLLPVNNIEIYMNNRINCIPNIPLYYTFYVYDTLDMFSTMYYNSSDQPFPHCSVVNNVHHCVALPDMTGYVYNDNNNNNVRDANEPYRANIRVTLSNGTFTTTNSNGYYVIAADNIGNYSLTCNAPNYFAAAPPSYNYQFNNYDTLIENNFALQATAAVDSLTLSVTSLNWAARFGGPMAYFIHYENSGTTTLSPTIIFNYNNSQLIYDSSSNAAIINNGTNLQLNETSMVAGEQKDLIAFFHVNTTAVIGDSIHINASATAGTATAVDSAVTEIRGPFDPNDKSATSTLTPEQVANGKYINYNIRFQNEGNDTAFNVVIADTLSSFLQASTLEMINTSHPCKTTVNGNIVYFEFINILLPDSNVNQLKSHGFVSFKIKPQSSVTVNTSIPNYASIYFDYNLPVVTNTAVTQIQNAVVLPLKLLSFNIEKQTKVLANAYWTTSNEYNVKDFSVEVSSNGKDFTSIASEISKGGQYNSYTKSVAVPATSIVYYRLKITDIDGRFYYGPVVTLKSNAEAIGFSFQNNPVKNKLIVSIEDASLTGTTARIINAQGAVVQKIYFTNDPAIIDISSLPAGTYVLKTIKGSKQFVVIK